MAEDSGSELDRTHPAASLISLRQERTTANFHRGRPQTRSSRVEGSQTHGTWTMTTSCVVHCWFYPTSKHLTSTTQKSEQKEFGSDRSHLQRRHAARPEWHLDEVREQAKVSAVLDGAKKLEVAVGPPSSVAAQRSKTSLSASQAGIDCKRAPTSAVPRRIPAVIHDGSIAGSSALTHWTV